ncbi:symmetrical bis(5'-nucleosyl)-tetraphosphatase [Halomonas sp. MCCC 1A17488]|uniref:symmetrical bis(5'-nucleosyl)-tetraphosphatase n=1 Tax=unclassified Halomonas TaxID=2609666 RepID=UPI0018D25AA8|nr:MULTISPECIES: symmetrical bis(5'-nucleosyl)-tetraphosphatase [unclassified Halomonas]MCE8016305.1 symmetrical bis(5'-nucleosyl)-tetraphosphatase [Halomonas sp. MCCC 1A17488]MCG3239638.1 symmetrical bis(5'-nucleosyl)-tetraphosphatase [Halomonas sp. MCCC 1A17488]QPP50450.1 symmetrical bis(5'-nucleosyl)-tetraphosphatase [Halomonas sp. SS10-MC5]
MTVYAVGDLQGCHAEFVELLERIDFDPARDRLWLAGDLVNRGPESLACLREVRALGDAASTVLGNHDLHLLAVARGGARLNRKDTLDEILSAPDREPLLDWLQSRPLLVRQDFADHGDTLMTHAGLLPRWSADEAAALAAEVEARLASESSGAFLERMYGNEPSCWQASLDGIDRLRVIVNVLTRMRFIDADGCLDFCAKEGLDSAPAGFAPWFRYPRRDDVRLLFGHWAALEGRAEGARVRTEALDTGCVWGGCLTALNLTTGERIGVPGRRRR